MRKTHETPKAKRREFAREIAFRKRHNPERPDNKKLSHAAVKYETTSLHRGQACQNCLHFIAANPPRCEAIQSPIAPKAWCKRYEKAQVGESAADRGYRGFHGRGPDKHYILDINSAELQDPYSAHPELFACGPLVRFIVGEGIKLSGEDGEDAEIVEDYGWVREINFLRSVGSVNEYHRRLEEIDPERVDQAMVNRLRSWLSSIGCPDVAGVPLQRNETSSRARLLAKQLYIVGGNQNIDDLLPALGVDASKDHCDLGFAYLIEYFTQKKFDKYQAINYWHHFGELTGVQPRLMYNQKYKRLYLVGGEYVVKAAGIDN